MNMKNWIKNIKRKIDDVIETFSLFYAYYDPIIPINIKPSEIVLAVRCPNCGDTWKVDDENETCLLNLTDCWSCKKEYIPHFYTLFMYEFVFNAMKNCKGA